MKIILWLGVSPRHEDRTVVKDHSRTRKVESHGSGECQATGEDWHPEVMKENKPNKTEHLL